MRMRLHVKAQRRVEEGYSLIELLTVMAIIVILAAVSLPNLAGYLRIYKIRGAAQQVASELQAARFQAIKKNAHLGVVLVILDARTYRTVIEDDMTLDANGAVSGAGGGPAGTPRSIAGILADPACATGSSCPQAGPVRRLPDDVQFLPAAVPALRFNRLGAVCEPGSAACPAIDTGANYFLSDAPGSWNVTVVQMRTNLRRTVRVTAGGRIYQ